MSPSSSQEEKQSSPAPPLRRTMGTARRVACALLLIVGGCGDSPVEKCDDMLSTICSRLVECVGGVSQQACLHEFQASVPCGATTDVSAGYDRCMGQLRGFTCSTLFPTDPMTGEHGLELPADCKGVIQLGGDDTSGKPVPLDDAIGSVVQSEP